MENGNLEPTNSPVTLFLSTNAGWMNRKQEAVIDCLIEENRVLKDQLQGRKIKRTDEIRCWLAIKRRASGWNGLCNSATIARPETILRWHRRLVALKYDFTYRRRPRESIEGETKRWAPRMARERTSWGYTRIQGALCNLKHKIGRTLLVLFLHEAGMEPSPERSKRTGLATILKRHWNVLAAADFFIMKVWTTSGLVRYSVFFVIDLATWELTFVHIDCQWSGEPMVQLARDLTDPIDGFLRGKWYLIVDRDPLYTQAFRELLRSSGTVVMNLPADAYVMNTYTERFVRTIRTECLDHLVFFGERSLVKAVRVFEKHYNSERNHQSLENRIIRSDPQVFAGQGAVHCVEHLGGLLKFYRRKAA